MQQFRTQDAYGIWTEMYSALQNNNAIRAWLTRRRLMRALTLRGEKMSRTKAKQKFTCEDLEAQTAGVECRKDKAVIDEISGAYKDIEEVMCAQSDLVEVVAELKQGICVKG